MLYSIFFQPRHYRLTLPPRLHRGPALNKPLLRRGELQKNIFDDKKIIAVDPKIFAGELQSVGDGALGRALLRAESAQPAGVQARRGVQRVPSDQTHQRGER